MSGTFTPPTSGSFAGMSRTALQAALQAAQEALIDLSTGVKEATVSYAMGGETRSVTYSRTNVEDVRRLIQELQRALGMPAGQEDDDSWWAERAGRGGLAWCFPHLP